MLFIVNSRLKYQMGDLKRSAKNMPQLLKKILRNTTLVFVLLIVAFLALPSVVAVFSGGYSYESYHEEELPDNKGSIVLSKRLAFPVNELIDPSIVVSFSYLMN